MCFQVRALGFGVPWQKDFLELQGGDFSSRAGLGGSGLGLGLRI